MPWGKRAILFYPLKRHSQTIAGAAIAVLPTLQTVLFQLDIPMASTPVPASQLAKENPEVFVSYSRRDQVFVRQLHDAFSNAGRTVWVDWQDIPPVAKWRDEIAAGILKANNFLFVLSPDSVVSEECQREVDYAVEHNKRLIVIVCRKVDPRTVRSELASLNWIFFEEDNFVGAFQTLLTAIDTDLKYVREHTSLLLKAQEWSDRANDKDCLLQGKNLEQIECWLSQNSEKNPRPTPLQWEYAQASRMAETARQKQRTRALTIGLVSISLLATVAVVQSFIAEARRRDAVADQIRALSATSDAFFTSNREFDGLLEGLHAGRLLKNANWVSDADRIAVMANFGRAVYRIRERNQLFHNGFVTRVSFSPDGQLLASGSESGTRLWKLDGTLLKTFTGSQDSRIPDVSFSPDGQTIAAAGNDGKVRLWKPDGTLIKVLSQVGAVRAVAFSPDGQLLASGGDAEARLWKADGTPLAKLPGVGIVWTVAFSPDSQLLALAGSDQTVALLTREGKRLRTFKGHNDFITSVSFSPDGRTIASASIDGVLKLWTLAGQVIFSRTGHAKAIYGVAFRPDGKLLATASADNTIKLWKPDGTIVANLYGHRGLVNGVKFSPDGKTLASASQDQTVRLWQEASSLMTLLVGHQGSVNGISFHPKAPILVSGSSDTKLRFWRLNGDEIKILKAHESKIYTVKFSPDGERIVSAGLDGSIKLWQQDGTPIRTLTRHQGFVNSVSFSSDGKQIATAGKDNTIKLWDRDGQFIRSFPAHQADINDANFSPDGRTIASASSDRTVKLWQLDGKEIRTLPHGGGVRAVSFSPDGQTLATASEDRLVRLWNLDGKLIKELPGHEDIVTSVVFNPDGSRLASTSDDRTAKVWKSDGTLMANLTGYTGSVAWSSFSPDGKTLATASEDGRVTLWNLERLNLDALLQEGCHWLSDYLRTNPRANPKDQKFCAQIR